ncbi:hypothetical protein PV797_04705 [Clostridiaceae bacterium M8S5]|nr:hypothetical protein PV797_04705 [Clostridiaceae bacterium M8S5]
MKKLIKKVQISTLTKNGVLPICHIPHCLCHVDLDDAESNRRNEYPYDYVY